MKFKVGDKVLVNSTDMGVQDEPGLVVSVRHTTRFPYEVELASLPGTLPVFFTEAELMAMPIGQITNGAHPLAPVPAQPQGTMTNIVPCVGCGQIIPSGAQAAAAHQCPPAIQRVKHWPCPDCGAVSHLKCGLTQRDRDIWNTPAHIDLDTFGPSLKCECGSEACGSPKHSTWCPKYE
jgi:hypothetical protein